MVLYTIKIIATETEVMMVKKRLVQNREKTTWRLKNQELCVIIKITNNFL